MRPDASEHFGESGSVSWPGCARIEDEESKDEKEDDEEEEEEEEEGAGA